MPKVLWTLAKQAKVTMATKSWDERDKSQKQALRKSRPMTERQIWHGKLSLVLSARFLSSNDVPFLLLNQPIILKISDVASYSTVDGLWEEKQYAWFVITIAGCRQSWHASAELAVLCIDKHDEHLESLHSDCMASICFSMKTIISSAQPKLSGLLDAPWMTFYKQMINSVYMQTS